MVIQCIKKISFSEVYVVFADNTTLWWLRFLRHGFRHCYVVLKISESSWLELNPMSNQIFVNIAESLPDYDYISYLHTGNKIISLSADAFFTPLKPAPIGLFTCVEFTKRLLGIHDVSIITPYQLYKKLKIVGKKS